MRFVNLTLFIACAGWPAIGAAQNAAETEKIADTMVRLCVGGGRTEATSGGGTGGADLSLRSLDVTGNLKGEFKISRSSAEGLVNGLDPDSPDEMTFGQLRAPISIVKSDTYAVSSSRILTDPTGERRNWQFCHHFRGLRSCRPNPSGESGLDNALSQVTADQADKVR